MRHPIGFFALFLAQPPRRTTSCSHCGDSFTGDLADGRTWLTEHGASEHRRPAYRDARRRPELGTGVRPRPAHAGGRRPGVAAAPMSTMLMASPPAVDPTK
jgi:hypothetical protein